jgi:uncharacterized protein (DUF2267 family)
MDRRGHPYGAERNTDQIGPDRKLAWHVLSGTRVLRDRLRPDDAANLAAQLPLFVRGAFYDQYRPSQQPLALRTQDEFVQRIEDAFGDIRPVDPAMATRAVFAAASFRPGEITRVRRALLKGFARFGRGKGMPAMFEKKGD